METQPFNQEQCEGMARMLVQAKERAQAELESDRDIDHQVEREVVPKLAKQEGALELILNVRKLRKEAADVDAKIRHLGFECTDDRTVLRWDAPESLQQVLEAAKRSARMENKKSLKKFNLAILGVWAADTAEDARKIVEGLL